MCNSLSVSNSGCLRGRIAEITPVPLEKLQCFSDDVIANINVGIIVYDTELRYLFWSRYMEKLTGIHEGELIGKRAFDVYPHLKPEGIDSLFEKALKGKEAISGNLRSRIFVNQKELRLSGHCLPYIASDGSIVGVIAIVHEISSLKEIEEQKSNLERLVWEARKQKSLQKSLSSFVHDISNFFMAAMGNLHVAERMLDKKSEAFEPVKAAFTAIERAQALSRTLLVTSGRNKVEKKEKSDLAKLVTEVVYLFSWQIPGQIKIKCCMEKNMPLVDMSAVDIQQLSMNLLLNAVDAIGDKSGKIKIIGKCASSMGRKWENSGVSIFLTPGHILPFLWKILVAACRRKQ